MKRQPDAAPEPFWLANRLALRPEEAARALGISERTLRRLGPKLKRVRDGGTLLYPVEAIREWLRRAAQVEGDAIEAAVREAIEKVTE